MSLKRGRKPGTPKTGGRTKGTPNKYTADIRTAAQKHGQDALDHLVFLMNNAENESTQAIACKEILDRAYGKSVVTADVTVKRENIDFTDAELAAIARASSSGTSRQTNGKAEPSRLH